MADFQKRDRLLDFKGGVLTDAPAILRPVEAMENLLPPQGFGMGLDPRDGIEAIIKVESQVAPHTGIGIFEITIDDCGRQKILALMDKATGEYRLLTKHTDQEGRVSIPPETGGELPVTPEVEPVFGNLMYFAAATATAAAGATTGITVEAANAGGTCDWGIDFVTAVAGVDLEDQTGTVTADENTSGTINVTVSADATPGRTFDVYLADPAAVDTYLKNPTVCRVTVGEYIVTNPMLYNIRDAVDGNTPIDIISYDAETEAFTTNDTVLIPEPSADSSIRVMRTPNYLLILEAFHSAYGAGQTKLSIFKVSQVIADTLAPVVLEFDVPDRSEVGGLWTGALYPYAGDKAILLIETTMHTIDLVTGDYTSAEITNLPSNMQEETLMNVAYQSTVDINGDLIAWYRTNEASGYVAGLVKINPATAAVTASLTDTATEGSHPQTFLPMASAEMYKPSSDLGTTQKHDKFSATLVRTNNYDSTAEFRCGTKCNSIISSRILGSDRAAFDLDGSTYYYKLAMVDITNGNKVWTSTEFLSASSLFANSCVVGDGTKFMARTDRDDGQFYLITAADGTMESVTKHADDTGYGLIPDAQGWGVENLQGDRL